MIQAARLWLIMALVILAGALLLAGMANAGCHVRKAVVLQQVYAYPVQQNVFYSVGEAARFEAILDKKLAALQQANTQQQQAAGSLIESKCVKCHADFANGIDCETYLKFDRFYMQIHNGASGPEVPAKMQQVLGSMSEVDYLNIKAEMQKFLAKPATTEEAGVLK